MGNKTSTTRKTANENMDSNTVLSDELNRLREGVTKRGSKKCAEWLAYCLETGWKKEQLDELEKVYWKWRDKNTCPRNRQKSCCR